MCTVLKSKDCSLNYISTLSWEKKLFVFQLLSTKSESYLKKVL